MAKRRGRSLSIDSMMAELSQIDARRNELVASIRSAVSTLVDGVASPFSAGTRRGRPAAAMKTAVAGSRKRRRKMSSAQRKAVSTRMKKYWAGRRAAKK